MYQPEQRVIRLRATGPNHQWAMEMMTECQIHHRDGRKWGVIQEKLNQHGLHVTIQEITFIKTQEKTEAKTMTNEIEKTRRDMYDMLEAMRKAKKHPTMLRAFEEALEEHLESLRKHVSNLMTTDAYGIFFGSSNQFSVNGNCDSVKAIENMIAENASLISRLAAMTENRDELARSNLALGDDYGKIKQERDEIQGRLHAFDHAFDQQSLLVGRQTSEIGKVYELNRIAGEELIRVQGIARQHLDDCRFAEKMSDELDEKLRSAQAVIGQQEQLITGQRLAIAELYMERSGFKKRGCAHEFHPAFPGGERCVYCCEAKP